MSEKAVKKADRIFREHNGIMSTSDAIDSGIHRETLYEMVREGYLERISRGLYRLAGLPPLSNPDLVTVSLRIPGGVVCLISALNFHGLTTQVPHHVYVAIERGSEKPRLESPPIRVFRFSGQAFSEGIEKHDIDNVPIRVYCVAKTVADCFKFRNRIGMDVTMEALKDYRRSPQFDIDELMHFARICRVANVMQPYVEALL